MNEIRNRAGSAGPTLGKENLMEQYRRCEVLEWEGTMYAEDYGEVKGIEPEEFYAGPWSPCDTVVDADGQQYDIVIDRREQKIAWVMW